MQVMISTATQSYIFEEVEDVTIAGRIGLFIRSEDSDSIIISETKEEETD